MAEPEDRPAAGDTWSGGAPPAPAPEWVRDGLRPGAQVGPYRIGNVLGRGGMGIVFDAHDTARDRPVAVKTLPRPDPAAILRLKQEFRIVADLWHPHVVRIHELFADAGHCFIVMERIDGAPFPALPENVVGDARWALLTARLLQLFDAVTALHAAGVLHLDLKPSNVRVTPEGRVVVLDFGIAASLDERAVDTAPLRGTPAYMAPEALDGARPGPAADVYALGLLLYEGLTGTMAFDGSPGEIRTRKQLRPVPAPSERTPGVPAQLDALCVRLTDRLPARRPTAAEALAVLRAAPSASAPRGVSSDGDLLVGRQAELTALHAALAASREGQPSVVLIHGASGVGKTALMHRFVEELESDGGVVFRGRCHPRETIPCPSIDGVVDGLAQWLAAADGRHARFAVSDLQAAARLFPVLGPAPQQDEPDPLEARRAGADALGRILGVLARERPLVLWIDDLQWGDADGGALLADLLSGASAPRALVVLTTRDMDGGAFLPVFRERSRALHGPSAAVRALAPLGADECLVLASRLVARASGDGARASELAQVSGGNPFLLRELAYETGTHATTIDAVLERRLERVPEASRRVFEALCVAGAPVAAGLVTRAIGVAEDDPILPLLAARLVSYRVVGPTRRLECYHDRLREVGLERLEPADRRALHLALARAATDGELPAELLAWHLWEGGEAAAAARGAERAAAEAMEQLAFDRAAMCLAQAVAWREPDDPRRSELLTARGHALAYAGRGAEAAAALLEAAELRPALAPSLRRSAAEHLLVSGHLDRGLGLIAALSRESGVSFPAVAPWLVLAVFARAAWLGLAGVRLRPRSPERAASRASAAELCWTGCKGLVAVDPFRAVHLALQAVSRGAADGREDEVLRALAVVAVIALGPLGGRFGRWAERILDHVESRALALGDTTLHAFGRVSRGNNRLVDGRWEEARTIMDDAAATLRAQAPTAWWERNMAVMGTIRALEEVGRFGEQAQLATEILERSVERDDRYGQYLATLAAATPRIAAWDIPEARRLADHAERVWTPRGFHLQHFYIAKTRVLCDLAEGQAAMARARIDALWPPLARSGFLAAPILRLDAYGLRATVNGALAAATGDHDALRRARNDANRLARDARPDIASRGWMLRGALAGPAEAIPALRRAEDAFRARGQRPLAAVCRLRVAQIEDHPGEAAGAADELRALGVRVPDRWAELFLPAQLGGAKSR